MTPEIPPTPPRADSPKRKFWKRAIWFSAALIVIPPMVGILGTVTGMMSTFTEMSRSDSTVVPDALAGQIGNSMITTAIGLCFSAVGVVCLIVSLVKFQAAGK